MWADEDFSGSGGGFDVSGYASPGASATEATKSSKKPSSIFPVAIKQIIDNTDDPMLIAGLPVSMMTVVGVVKSVEVTSTKIVYTVQDWSGIIGGMLWLDGDGANNQKESNVIENIYCRMSGTKRMHDGKSCIFIYNIVAIEEYSEILYHYMQVAYNPLKAEELKHMNQDKMDNTFMGVQSSTSNFSTDNMGLTPQQNKVYRVLQQSRSEAGMEKREIFESLQRQTPLIEIEKVLEFLITEGHVYNTIDDNHFRVTDG